ncbi:hypothetical protein NA57DRAFT_58542 [Rhizodiscina lignyota]|uniref:Uncharacterized protein n=1 Tax=Rhizodiscina lignyota TaxID=1504668 RepID=A0A9P4M3E7_9PEZI|nr:hypothetical protein NA57DRAFT_58542 [Rhizodiscina lignyota]
MERVASEHAGEGRDSNTPTQRGNTARAPNGVQSAIQMGGRVRSDDSWIEVSSQPSSSSLSSAGAPSPADEIITTGLRIQHDSNAQRRRRQLDRARTGGLHMAQSPRGASSSQEEYEESESESDRVMTSSNEGLAAPSPLQREWRPSMSSTSSNLGDGEDEDSDENATAINVGRGAQPHLSFQPQPNAFNRPPSTSGQRAQSAQLYNPSSATRPAVRSGSQRHSYPTQRQTQHTPFNAISPSYQADHDAALRASLSTLLSCAAAARGLPKSGNAPGTAPGPSARIEPTGLRIVPESDILGPSPPDTRSRRTNAGTSSPRSRSADKSKRRGSSKDRSRAAKKRRASSNTGGFAGHVPYSSYGFGSYSIDDISPTLLTWVVSAGVVVLVSALSFSAGYVVGKEAGRTEAVGGVGSCGREVVGSVRGSGLRRSLVERVY